MVAMRQAAQVALLVAQGLAAAWADGLGDGPPTVDASSFLQLVVENSSSNVPSVAESRAGAATSQGLVGGWGKSGPVHPPVLAHSDPPHSYWDDVIHYIDFEEDIYDWKGNSAVQPLCGNGAFVAGANPGGKAYHCGSSASYHFQLLSGVSGVMQYSVSFWFKPDSTVDSNSGRIDWLYGEVSHLMDCYMCYHLTMNRDGVADMRWYHTSPDVGVPSPTFVAGNWYHVLLTQKASTREIYLNGVLQDTENGMPPGVGAAAHSINVGMWGATGALDTVVFYRRSFTSAEVQQVMAEESTAQPVSTADDDTLDTDESSVVGDPHVVNMARERFEIRSDGEHKLIQIPRNVGNAEKVNLRVDATIHHMDANDCHKTFVRSLAIFGNLTEPFGLLRVSSGSDAPGSPLLVNTQSPAEFFGHFPGADVKAGEASLSLQLGKIRFQVRKHYAGRHGEQKAYLNIRVKGLAKYSDDVGGLLGFDSHAEAEKATAGCAAGKSSLLGVGTSAAPMAGGGSSIVME